MTSSVTRYYTVGVAPFAGAMVQGFIRAKAAGVASSTIDLLKVPSGTAVGSGTAIVTQVNGNTGITANTNVALAVKTDGSQNVNAGDAIVMKVVTQGTETLTPPTILAIFE